jgi:ferredoxin
MTKTLNLLFNGKIYDCQPGETVLDALLRQKVAVPYACLKQTCMSCMMQSLNGTPPIKSQRSLKETLQLQNNFLACGCIPVRDMELSLNQETLTTQVLAEVVEMNRLNQDIVELVLQCETAVDYHGGQSVLLLNYEHIGKNSLSHLPVAPKAAAGLKSTLNVLQVPLFLHGSMTSFESVINCLSAVSAANCITSQGKQPSHYY